jgi:alpha-2-macroglobulin
VWVFRLSTGRPVEGAEVHISRGKEAVELGKTGRLGTVLIPEDKQIDASGVVIAQFKDELVALPLTYTTQSGISNWDYGLSMADENDLLWQYDAIPSNPLYRPGEKGALKIYVRKTGLMGPELAEHKEIPWALTDPRGEKIAEGKVDFNKYGTAVVDFALKSEAVTGKYQLQVNGRFVMEPFSVEVFTVPTLKVTMDQLSKSRAPLDVAGSVEFHVGGGVQNTKGEVALVTRGRPFEPPTSSSYGSFNFYDQNAAVGALLIGKNDFTTDKEGRFTSRFTNLDLPEYGTLIAEATVTDGDGMTVSGRTETTVSNRGWFPGTKLDNYFYDDGADVRAETIVLATNGEPLAGVKARYELTRRTWNTVRRLGSGNVFYYDSEMKEEKVANCEVVSALTPVSCALKPKGEGSYYIKITTAHQGKTGPERSESFWVSGPNSWAWGPRNNHDRIDIKPEKASYEFGEKARFIVQSPYKSGEALVTVERYGVIRHEVVKFSGGFWTYELPLEDSAYVPGVYVSVVMLKGRSAEKFEGGVDLGRPSFKMGYAQIQVSRQPTILKVEAKTAARFSPGDEVEVSLNVKDWKGRAVDGELAVTVVDDAVLQLVPGYKSFFEVLDTFYHIKGLGVWNYQTLTRLIGRRSFGKKGAAAGGGGDSGPEDMRSNFKTVAHWEPMLEVSGGKAKFKFKLPDNLTQWRVIAVAVDEKNRFGEGETTFKAILPVMLTPFFPPFLRAGDAFNGAFGVQNATEETISAELSAQLTGVSPTSVKQTKDVAPGIRELLSFPFTTDKPGELGIEARVKAGAYKDGVKISLPVKPDEGARHVSGGLVYLSGTQALDFTMPKEATAGSTRLKVYFTKSLLDGLDEAFRYVVHYPYGCWEQQTTGALFLTEYKEMEPWLAEFKFDAKEGDPRAAIQKYINKAPDYQRADGSMGYYPGDYSGDPYLTVFTGHAFGVYKKSGFTIPKTVEEKLRARLLAMKDHAGDMGHFTDFKPSMNAFIAAILVDLNDPEGSKLASRLYSQRSKMDLFGLGLLLKALPAQSKEAKALMEELLKKSLTRDTSVVFSEKIPNSAKNWLYSERRGQCVVVDALLRHGVNSALASKMIQGLAPDKRTARWGNTQENYFCFQTFRTYARLFESTDKVAEVAWTMGSDSRTLDVKRLQRPFVEYQEADLKTAPKAKAELKSGGNAYLHTRVFWSTATLDAKATGNGFTLQKTVLLKKGNAWTPLTGKVWTVKKGDLVKVMLKVVATGERYKVGLTDPIPAGWRALNPRLATTSVAQQVAAGTEDAPAAPDYDWWDWEIPTGFSSTDMRQDSVQFFADRLGATKTYDLEYLAQVTTVGEFLLPPTVVEEMYDEEWRANTAGVKVRVVD